MPQNIPDASNIMQLSVDCESELFGAWMEYVMHVKSQWNAPQYWGTTTFPAILDQDLYEKGLSYDRNSLLISGTSDAVTQWILTYA